MSDFLASALSQAKADLSTKRSAGVTYGKSDATGQPARKKSKWLSEKGNALRINQKNGATKSSSGLSDYDLERSRKALERKEKQYNKMFSRGTDMSLEGEAADNLLIDFDRKWAEGHRQESSDEEGDARLASDDDLDPIIEVEDEFGRLRKIRKSEALRHERPEIVNARPANLIYGRHLQKFNPDAQKKDQIWAEEEASREVHYDPNFEIRQRGTGYINLGRGQDRKERLNDLSKSHTETVQSRTEHGLLDPEPPALITVSTDPPASENNSTSKAVNESNTKEHHQATNVDEDFVHPSRRQQASDKIQQSYTADERSATRLKTGEAFLDSLL